MATCQQHDARVHPVVRSALAAEGSGALHLLAIYCLHANETGAKQPRQTNLPTAVSPGPIRDTRKTIFTSWVQSRVREEKT